MQNLKKQFDVSQDALQHTVELMGELRQQVDESYEALRGEMQRALNIPINDIEALKEYWTQPYGLVPRGARHPNEWWVITPKWSGFKIGWLDHEDKTHYYFVINRYMRWIGEIPRDIQDKLNFSPGLPVFVDGNMLYTGEQYQEQALAKFKQHLGERVGNDRIKVKKGCEFDLVADIIDSGQLPFPKKPVAETDWRADFDLRLPFVLEPEQEDSLAEGVDYFLRYGHIGVYWPTGYGKSLLTLKLLAKIKGPKVVFVPRLSLIEQWRARILGSPSSPALISPEQGRIVSNETFFLTYNSVDKIVPLVQRKFGKNARLKLKVFEEHHHLPANTFVKCAYIPSDYTFANSATPMREDGREKYVFALGGFPLGADWTRILSSGVLNIPRVVVYLLRSNEEKMDKLEELLETNLRTLIYSYWLDLGKEIAKRFNLPHVYGGVKDIYSTVLKSRTVVASSVVGEGISIPDIERIIEVAGLFGSRREQGQLFGRMLHTSKEGETNHYILMTYEEYEKYDKRLNFFREKGIRMEVIS